MTKLTTAFLGLAHIHVPGFVNMLNARTDDVRVKSVWDRDPERSVKRAAELNAGVAKDPTEILSDPEIDAVVVCSETVYHKELVTAVADAGKHVFAEKPLGLGAADSSAIADAIKRSGVTFQTGFFMRSVPEHQFIKREVAAGNLGQIARMRYTNCHSAALGGWFDTEWQWLADPKLAGGGAMLDLGAHPLDIIVSTHVPVLGPVTKVAATLGNGGGKYGSRIDEYGTALLTFQSGATAVLEASWVNPKWDSPVEIIGSEGEIQWMPDGLRYFSGRTGHDGPVTHLPKSAPHAFELFWDKLLGKPLPVGLVSVDEAAMASGIMEQIYHAAGRSTTS